jgi:NADH-quinone oxidoreductase subunit J
MIDTILFGILAVAALAGAVTVLLTRDVMHVVLGLGTFLLSVAGFFMYYGATFLAIGEVFLYVGGVLVLMVIAIMTVHRTGDREMELDNRHSLGAAVVAIAMFALLVYGLSGAVPDTMASVDGAGIEALGDTLLGGLLPHFEIIGGLLLAAMVAVLAITGGERE